MITIICDILDFDDNSEIIEKIHLFRNEILKKDSRYANFLMENGDIESTISEYLKSDENALWLANELLVYYIKPIINFIDVQNYDAAIIMYQNMLNVLKENYCIENNAVVISDYDQSQGGHGRVYKKVNC